MFKKEKYLLGTFFLTALLAAHGSVPVFAAEKAASFNEDGGVLCINYEDTVSYNGNRHIVNGAKKSSGKTDDIKVTISGNLADYISVSYKYQNNKISKVVSKKDATVSLRVKAKKNADDGQKTAIKKINKQLSKKANKLHVIVEPVDMTQVDSSNINVKLSKDAKKISSVKVKLGKSLNLTEKDYTVKELNDGRYMLEFKGNFKGTYSNQYCKVSFETNGGSSVASQSVIKGRLADSKVSTSKEGYDFDGWYSDKDLTKKYDFNAPVESDMTLYAKWTEVPVQITIAKAKLYDLNWSQFVLVKFEDGYSIENCRVEVDGRDITDSLTKVTDDGSIVKWELEYLNPGKITISSESEKQEIELSSKYDGVSTPEGKGDTKPGYMVAHGPVSVWDYYLTNYDTDGNLRTEPSKTTFSLSGSKENSGIPAYYSPDTELKKNGEAVIMFNANTDTEKEWFKAIDADSPKSLQLVSFDERLDLLNDSLEYEKKENVRHGSHYINEIVIKLGQKNLDRAGRFYVRVKSGKGTVIVPIHIVNEEAPELTLAGSGTVIAGQDLTFKIKKMINGIKNPTYAAELKLPDGTVKELEMLTDWYQISDRLYLYNSKDKDGNDRNKLTQDGEYVLIVHSDGYKDMSAVFYVGTSDAIGSVTEVDSVSSATRGSGSSGNASGGQQISADLKFDADLLINAMLLERAGVKCDTATAIVDRWEKMADWDSVCAKETKKGGFEWSDYIDAVARARKNGKYLTFAEYADTNADNEKETVPHGVKAVLEDNLLGDIQDDFNKNNKADPDGNVPEVSEESYYGILTFDYGESKDWLAAVNKITVDGEKGQFVCEKSDKYSPDTNEFYVNSASKGFNISKSCFDFSSYGKKEYTITIEAEGYNTAVLKLSINIGYYGQIEYTVEIEK